MNISAEFCGLEDEDELRAALHAWVTQLPVEQLPRLTFGQIESGSFEISILALNSTQKKIEARLQLWFRETMAGSSCGFEASPDAGYVELLLQIDRMACVAAFDWV